MKRSQLKEIIRQTLSEVLNEMDPLKSLRDRANKEEKEAALAQIAFNKAKLTMEEGDLDEMANQGIRFELAPNANPDDSRFYGKKSKILKAMQSINGPVSKAQVAIEMGYFKIDPITKEKVAKQQPINTDFMDLVKAGAIVLSGEQVAPRVLNKPQPEPISSPATDDDDLEDIDTTPDPDDLEDDGDDTWDEPRFMDPEGGITGDMSDEEVDAGFPKSMGSEDEPEIGGDIEKIDKPSTNLSPAEVKILLLHGDLQKSIATIASDLNKGARSKRAGGIAGDISGDKNMTNLDNLRRIKAKKEQQLKDLMADNPWLSRFIVNDNPKNNPPEELDEWTKNKLQFYAGIIK
jgi:hypothetical protein